MSATNKTTNLELPLFVDDDKPSWLNDWNGAMNKIDEAVGNGAGGGGDNPTTFKTINGQTITGEGNIAVQPVLISAGESQNIKTVNGQSILGKGDITINTGGSGSDIQVVQITGNSPSAVMSQQAVTTELAKKQNILIGSGTGQNVKTINGQSIVGEGDIQISGGSSTGNSNIVNGFMFGRNISSGGLSSFSRSIAVNKGNNDFYTPFFSVNPGFYKITFSGNYPFSSAFPGNLNSLNHLKMALQSQATNPDGNNKEYASYMVNNTDFPENSAQKTGHFEYSDIFQVESTENLRVLIKIGNYNSNGNEYEGRVEVQNLTCTIEALSNTTKTEVTF